MIVTIKTNHGEELFVINKDNGTEDETYETVNNILDGRLITKMEFVFRGATLEEINDFNDSMYDNRHLIEECNMIVTEIHKNEE